MFNLLIKGGLVMIPITLGSIFGLAIVLERLWVFKSLKSIDNHEFTQKIFRAIKGNKLSEALQMCEKNIFSPLAVILKIGIERRSLSPERLEKVLEQVGNNQIHRLERYLGFLATIIAIEPLLGFLGTITGLIRAFMSWEHAGANITVNALAGGIYEAMITTAAGLTVAIPLYLFYNYFINHIKYIANDLNNYSIQLIEIISEGKQAETNK
ncbi:MAG: MotA/TolQ/ExbB proton channel family protein [Candidatus Omnitrophica bacterium]|jgi:biopolymer transport protein ExbB|nr:MotA/TolQ/ExbB proton channel family protein [Candidatus Omnitrophota bacterium]MDD5660772.1 MotA/TolQ/ExbB proton channel family protein [Candidatus Omnitrophota bacterium]